MKFSTSVPVLMLIAVVCSANPRSTQAQNNGAPVVKISPAAQKQLDKTKAAYKALKFYASDVQVTTTGLPDNRQLSAKIAWQKPNRWRIEADKGEGLSTTVSNGAKLWMTIGRAPNQYLEKSVASTPSLLSDALAKVGIDKTTLVAFVTGKDALPQFGGALQSVELTKVKNGDKVATDRVSLVMKTLSRKNAGTATFVISTKDNLLRSVKIVKTVSGQPVTTVETYNNLRTKTGANNNFEYSPRFGERRVEEFERSAYDPRLAVGARPFRIDVKDIDGKMVDLDDYKGKVVMVVFWARWCPRCIQDAPNLATFYNKHHSQGLEIIGINMDSELLNLRAYMKYVGMTWRQTYDGKGWDNAMVNRFGVTSVPFTLIIGRDGKIADQITVNNSDSREQAVIKALAVKAE